MKGWLGIHGEAEKEQMGMVVNKGVPECYFKTVGMAGGDTVKSVLLGRCQVSPSAAFRVVYKVVGGCDSGGGGSAGQVPQASDDRVVVLFSGDRAEKHFKSFPVTRLQD